MKHTSACVSLDTSVATYLTKAPLMATCPGHVRDIRYIHQTAQVQLDNNATSHALKHAGLGWETSCRCSYCYMATWSTRCLCARMNGQQTVRTIVWVMPSQQRPQGHWATPSPESCKQLLGSPAQSLADRRPSSMHVGTPGHVHTITCVWLELGHVHCILDVEGFVFQPKQTSSLLESQTYNNSLHVMPSASR